MRAGPALSLVAALVAIALVPTLPYGYYSVMRWIVCAACAWIAISSYQSHREAWTWVWGVVAGIYNPIIRVHADRNVWSVVNLATIALAAWYGLKMYQSDKENDDGRKT